MKGVLFLAARLLLSKSSCTNADTNCTADTNAQRGVLRGDADRSADTDGDRQPRRSKLYSAT